MGEREELLSLSDVAEWTGLSLNTLYQLRHRGEGPPGFKIGTSRGSPLRFRRSAIEAWLREYEQVEQQRLARLKAG
jgi:predicted DNA-binding transcriptional regulator AlpA